MLAVLLMAGLSAGCDNSSPERPSQPAAQTPPDQQSPKAAAPESSEPATVNPAEVAPVDRDLDFMLSPGKVVVSTDEKIVVRTDSEDGGPGDDSAFAISTETLFFVVTYDTRLFFDSERDSMQCVFLDVEKRDENVMNVDDLATIYHRAGSNVALAVRNQGVPISQSMMFAAAGGSLEDANTPGCPGVLMAAGGFWNAALIEDPILASLQ